MKVRITISVRDIQTFGGPQKVSVYGYGVSDWIKIDSTEKTEPVSNPDFRKQVELEYNFYLTQYLSFVFEEGEVATGNVQTTLGSLVQCNP